MKERQGEKGRDRGGAVEEIILLQTDRQGERLWSIERTGYSRRSVEVSNWKK